MARLISVEPSGDGWAVRCDQSGPALIFRSGRDAEDAAKRMGERIAEAGQSAEIQIYLRGGALAGRFVCGPAPGPSSERVEVRSARSLEPA